MYSPREVAREAGRSVRKVAEERGIKLRRSGASALWAESTGTSPSIRLDVRHENGSRWSEFIESTCTRGAHAFDMTFVDALVEDGWVVLHYPAYQVNEEFARLKAEELLELGLASGMQKAEVWVYLYDRDGEEIRVA